MRKEQCAVCGDLITRWASKWGFREPSLCRSCLVNLNNLAESLDVPLIRRTNRHLLAYAQLCQKDIIERAAAIG